MTVIYPAIFHKEENSYWAEFPDLEGCNTFGETLEETVLNAKEALEGYCFTVLESGQKMGRVSDIKDIKCDEEDSFTTLIECELTENIQKAVKKTLTIPFWMNEMAVKENINFSAVLQSALKKLLNIYE